ncbi:MAG: hypothetical protein GX369_07265 [Euryarchaeota archaeon]|nr:hypothetical protein [Euryarchaeota archaeon]
MGKADALSQIKEAETKAKKTLEEAEDKQKAIISSARREAVEKLQAAERDLRAKREAALDQERKALAINKDKLLSEGNNEATAIEAKAVENIPKAKRIVKQHFERAFDVTTGTNE